MATSLSSIVSLRVDFNYSDPCYVLQLASDHGPGTCLPDNVAVAAALSNNTVKLFACASGDMRNIAELAGHKNRITDVEIPGPSCAGTIVTSSEDGSVRCWDSRTGQEGQRFQVHGEEVHSCSCSENVVVAGTSGSLVFWDRRTQRQMARLDDTHMDIVTALQFHPQRSAVCLSASEDGLVAVFNFANGINDDNAFVAAMNIQNAPTEIGFWGGALDRLWCRSGTESLHLWNWEAAATEVEQQDEADMVLAPAEDIVHWNEARECLSAQTSACPDFRGQVDYLLGCHYDPATDQLYVAAGSHKGDAAIVPLTHDGRQARAGAVQAVMSGGHVDTVRSVLFHGSTILTGGEDARLCLWGDVDALEAELHASTAVTGAVKPAALRAERHSPY